MAARRGKRSVLAGRKATVAVERNGAMIRIDDVPASEAGVVLADILSSMRALEGKYPELIRDLDPVGGGSPVEVVDDDYADEGKRRRVGFRAE